MAMTRRKKRYFLSIGKIYNPFLSALAEIVFYIARYAFCLKKVKSALAEINYKFKTRIENMAVTDIYISRNYY